MLKGLIQNSFLLKKLYLEFHYPAGKVSEKNSSISDKEESFKIECRQEEILLTFFVEKTLGISVADCMTLVNAVKEDPVTCIFG